MKKQPILLTGLLLLLTSCGVSTTYIGKSYAPTTDPESFFDWTDVPRPYETIGHIEATPLLGSLEKAQTAIEQRAAKEGADAVVFEGIGRKTYNPTTTTTENVRPNADGSTTRTSTSTYDATRTQTLHATFIRYK